MKLSFARAALVIAAVMCSIAPASWADTIAGSTTGCFASVNGNSTSPCSTIATDAGLTFNQGTFGVLTDGNGFAAIGGGSNNLGTFTLDSTVANYTGDTFNLAVTITDPAAGLGGVPAMLTGDVIAGPGGGVTIAFTNPTLIPLANGENLTLTVNTVSVFPSGASTPVTGTATVPEPASMLLLGTGLSGAAMFLRRRGKMAVL